MKISWFITTMAVSVAAVLMNYLSNPLTASGVSIVSGFLEVIAINLIVWLPAVKYLHNNSKVSLRSSVIASLAAACLGIASIIGIISLIFAAANKFQLIASIVGQATGYTTWTIGHIHYWTVVVHIAVLWAINGTLFWVLYGKFVTNK